MEKIKTVHIKLDADERKLLNRTTNLLIDLIDCCQNEPHLACFKELVNEAWTAINSILEETDI